MLQSKRRIPPVRICDEPSEVLENWYYDVAMEDNASLSTKGPVDRRAQSQCLSSYVLRLSSTQHCALLQGSVLEEQSSTPAYLLQRRPRHTTHDTPPALLAAPRVG